MTQTYNAGNVNNISHHKAAWCTLDGTDIGWLKNVTVSHKVEVESQTSANNNGVPLYAIIKKVEAFVEAECLETTYTSGLLEKAFHLTSLDGGTILGQSSSLKGSQPTYYSNLRVFVGDGKPCEQFLLPKVYVYADSNWEFDGGDKSDAKMIKVRFVAIEDTTITDVDKRFIQYIQTTDTTPFTVSSVTPTNGGTGFSTSGNISVTFSETPGEPFRDNFSQYLSLVEDDGTKVPVSDNNIAWGGTGYVTATITGGTGGIGVLTSSAVHILQVSPAFRASSGKYLLGGTGWYETDFTTA